MTRFPTPFSGEESGEDAFDGYDEFAPAHLPDPGPFLEGHAVLSGADHAAFHRLSRALFEERGVYDMTFGYNLARLNLDRRHPNAGYRYARERERVLRAEFTPTTPFCPQSHTLTVGSLRAWNGLADRHGYERVRVRVHPMHHQSEAINEELARREEADGPDESRAVAPARATPPDGERGDGDAPF